MNPETIKLFEKEKKNLRVIHNSIMSAWCFRELAEWKDVYKKLGLSDEIASKMPQGQLTLLDLKAFLKKQKEELEQSQTIKNNPTLAIASIVNDNQVPRPEQPKEVIIDKVDTVITDPDFKTAKPLNADNNYGFVPLPEEKGFHFWYQKRGIVEIVDKILEGKTGILLLAPGGHGKTFIGADVILRLTKANYADGKTFSHIQYLWITRQTIVEQTRRVIEKYYSLNPYTDVEVINVDAVL